jgi:hypothetical protein
MQTIADQYEITVAAGQYYLADPCYVLDNEEIYDGLIEQDLEIDNLVILDTIHGDGMFLDQFGNEYGVDSGQISLIPVSVSDCKVLNKRTPIKKHRGGITMQEKTLTRNPLVTVQMVTFTKPTKVSRKNGVMHFGAIEIDVR